MHTYNNSTSSNTTPVQFNQSGQTMANEQYNYPNHQQQQQQPPYYQHPSQEQQQHASSQGGQFQQHPHYPTGAQSAPQYPQEITSQQHHSQYQHSVATTMGKQQASSPSGGWPSTTARTHNPYQNKSSSSTLPSTMVAPPQQHPGHIVPASSTNAPPPQDNWDNQQFQQQLPPFNQQYHPSQAQQHQQQQQQYYQQRQFSDSSVSHASSYDTRRSSTSGGSSSNDEAGDYQHQRQQQRRQVPLTYYPSSNQLAQSQRSGNSSSLGTSQKSSAQTINSGCTKATPRLVRLRDPISIDEIQLLWGTVRAKAVTNSGASQIQAAFEQHPMETVEILGDEIQAHLSYLSMDKYGSYVVRALLQNVDKDDAIKRLNDLATNEDLLMTMCTKDLHSRRMIQFLLEFKGAERCRYLFDLVMRRPMQIVRTQQGCITLQRILDEFPEDREKFFANVRSSFMEYALDPFGNYIVQYMLAEGNQVENSNTLALYCRGQLHTMICHKYASNVIEKCFGLVTPELQREIIEELFNASEESVKKILTDSCANYVVQAAIRTASYRDVTLIERRVSPLLDSIPYGNKIKARLNRRLAAH